MSKSIEFYFDFVSPYSYIAHKQIQKVEKKNTFKIKYMPICLGGLHNSAGVTAPAFIPVKAKFMIRDAKLVSEKKNITFKFNSYFPIKTLNLMRGTLISQEDKFEKLYIKKIFDAIWKDGLNMNDQTIIDKVIKNMDMNPKTFFLRAVDIKIKNKLKKLTDDALRKGIFGAPTFVVGNKIFWGQDRLSYAVNEAEK